jgi:hypothetical protein
LDRQWLLSTAARRFGSGKSGFTLLQNISNFFRRLGEVIATPIDVKNSANNRLMKGEIVLTKVGICD